jgi:hypothetical protein
VPLKTHNRFYASSQTGLYFCPDDATKTFYEVLRRKRDIDSPVESKLYHVLGYLSGRGTKPGIACTERIKQERTCSVRLAASIARDGAGIFCRKQTLDNLGL